MKVNTIYRKQKLNMTQSEAWTFFTSPFNLNTITPDFFNVEITSHVPEEIYAGLLIRYQMKAIFGIPMIWLSEIAHCKAPSYFIYHQGSGPFKFWSHEVRITPRTTGIILEDIVFYEMPLGWIGQFLNHVLIMRKLEEIFSVRHDYLQSKWPLC